MTTRYSGTGELGRDALCLLQPGFGGTTPPDWLLRLVGEGLGAVGLFARNIESPDQVRALTSGLRAERGDVLVAVDEEGGDVTRLETRTGSSFPGNLALGTVDDPALTRSVARELGRRLAECGIDLDWAPCADVNSDPDNPVIGVRSFGEDPGLAARHTAAYVEGLQSTGVAACTKHFPGHGDTRVDSHLDLPRIRADLKTMQTRELVPFRAAVAAGTKAVMSAHILVPALDPDRPATLSRTALTGLLRAPESEGGLGFEGLLVTDGMEMRAVSAAYGIERGSVLAIAAGADAICVGGGVADEGTVLRLRDAIVRAVWTGVLPEQRVAEAASRVRALAAWAGSPDGRGEPVEPAPGVGLEAARRALRVTVGRYPYEPLTGPVFVAAFTPLANMAAGDESAWGVAAELARLLPGTGSRTYRREDVSDGALPATVAGVLDAAADRTLVVVVRDVHRHSWMAEALHALLAARPDALVVETGVPMAEPAGALHIATHGAARVCGLAAAEVITGRGDGS
ncbi:glycoside hydrolase family 3 protein [Streptomyces meridianus]|uniref:Glycoside hydrolase family 3 protein n=1 Tax=Streptomyces meridianus TaxID=2938945 RepID=A0ABT0X0N1_9ACTN|nr:glycoside hydrolase family 3 protein [Streptomyces meridianus]MCM2576111.1 glycoside hydrolase family 3 protein [Streptomyces meridianus]